MISEMQNIGAYLKPTYATSKGAIVAGAASDAVEVTSPTIDRSLYESMQIALAYNTALTAEKAIGLTVKIQDSADGSNWNTAVTLGTTTVTSAAGGTIKDVYKLDVNLGKYDKYIRILTTADLTATATDTAEYATILNLAGSRIIPVA